MPEHSHDPAAGRETEGSSDGQSSASRLFDIRRVIGGLFTVYGVLVLGAGLLDGSGASRKAGGIDINIWSGLGMLALGLGMLLWMRLRPAATPGPNAGNDTGGDPADH